MCKYNALVLTLRKYRPQDFERLLKIDTACFAEGIAYSEEEMRYFLRQPSSIKLVGERATQGGKGDEKGEDKKDDEGEICGFIIADHFRPRRSRQPMGRIITIDVLPEARRSGLGGRLLDAVEDELKNLGCGHVSLETAVDNLAALRFYKKHGYTGLKILPRYYLNSIDALLMGKKLG
ncbi:MAG TPA: N-acetyltransferase [Candidatus Angelobacter sp.]|nr:N-acetyltransferase [Candidatus Angelobacter sp.]